jgi:hypothetical protein
VRRCPVRRLLHLLKIIIVPPEYRRQDIVQEAAAIVDAHCSWKWDLLQEADARVTHGALQRAIEEYHREGDDEWTSPR